MVSFQVTSVDTETAQFTLNTLKTLMKYRRVHPTKKYEAAFGVNVAHTELGFDVKVGDKIEVLAQKETSQI